MSNIHEHDPRTRLVREKFFTLRPKPLERYLWQQGLPQAAERVFWVHWEEGMRAGDWCSQLSLREVAQRCCIDPSTVTRAYQVLKKLELIRREDPGRDERNPFQQATAVTEVRVPRELLTELSRYPNRAARAAVWAPAPRDIAAASSPPERNIAAAAAPERVPAASGAPVTGLPRLRPRDFRAICGRLTAADKAKYLRALESGACSLSFEAASGLSPIEQAHILQVLAARAEAARAPVARPAAPVVAAANTATYIGPRRLNALEAARVRHRIQEAVPSGAVTETFRQVLWAVEEGALRRFELAKAVNIALKKIREGAWSRPNRLPPQWQVDERRTAFKAIGPLPNTQRARAETCSAA